MTKKARPFKYLDALASRLKEVRVKNKMTQANAGQIMGVTEGAVRSWENGVSEPPLAYLVYLCENFGYDLDWLLLGKETSAAEPQPQGDLEKELLLENRELAQENRTLARENRDLRKENADLKNDTLSSLAAQDASGMELGRN